MTPTLIPPPTPRTTVLELLAAGPLTMVQDLGRAAHREAGVPQGGAMDAWALQRANALVGNPAAAAALELVAGPLRLRCTRDAWFALAGARFELRVGGRVQAESLRVRVPAGEALELRGPLTGQYAVLAVDGGLDLPLCLGARATLLRAGLGGLEGRALRTGDCLPLGPARPGLQGRVGLHDPEPDGLLRFLPGPEWSQLDAASRKAFLGSAASPPWRLSPQSDRMGLRLQGPRLQRRGPELLSHPVAPGLVQLPPDGQPIVLGVDAQTTGGYPRLGQVAAVDVWKLAQLRPDSPVRFEGIDWAQARALQVERDTALCLMRQNLGLRETAACPST